MTCEGDSKTSSREENSARSEGSQDQGTTAELRELNQRISNTLLTMNVIKFPTATVNDARSTGTLTDPIYVEVRRMGTPGILASVLETRARAVAFTLLNVGPGTTRNVREAQMHREVSGTTVRSLAEGKMYVVNVPNREPKFIRITT